MLNVFINNYIINTITSVQLKINQCELLIDLPKLNDSVNFYFIEPTFKAANQN